MFFFFNSDNIITSINDLKSRQDLTAFEMDFDKKPDKSVLQELCIEIAKHTPDAKKGNNKDAKNEGRLNPFVGAILLKEENKKYKVYGACRSALHEGEHGECGLLTNILGDYIVDGCEMYVSLEPCTQESRHEWTEPCCEIIKNRRIKKVTIGMLDPNPDVAGQGIAYLTKQGIEVQLFDGKYQTEVLKDNADFISQFGDDGDPRLNRKIARILDTYISEDAVKVFLKESGENLGIDYNPDRWSDCKHKFYQKMIENQSIVDGKSNLLPFYVIDEFALFFFKEPYHTVDAASIRYIFNYETGNEELDNGYRDYNGPLSFAFESYYSKDEKINKNSLKYGFVEMLGMRYGGTIAKTVKEYNQAGINLIRDRIKDNNAVELVREAFVNAIMHRDYTNNKSFTTVTLSNSSIVIKNPIGEKLHKIQNIKELFESKELPSHPANPKLMRYFMMSNVCERNNNGFRSLLKTNIISLELEDDYILKTTINLK